MRFVRYLPLAIVIASLVAGSILDSQISRMPALLLSAVATALICLVWRLGWCTKSTFWKAVSGISLALIYVYTCYAISGHYPTERWPFDVSGSE